MLAWEWTLEKARDGEGDVEKKATTTRKISQTAQVREGGRKVNSEFCLCEARTLECFSFGINKCSSCVISSHLICLQATYDPSHGYNPQPIDIGGMALSRELQVCIFPSVFARIGLIFWLDVCQEPNCSIYLFPLSVQSMAEQLAENYHNTWGRKKKLELQSKGKSSSVLYISLAEIFISSGG